MTTEQIGIFQAGESQYGIMANPNSWSNTVSFFDLVTLKEVARFRTSPDGMPFASGYGCASPSRTAFDHNGNVWIANRGINTVVKIGIENFRDDIDHTQTSGLPEGSSTPTLLDWGSDARVLKEYHLLHDGLTEARTPADPGWNAGTYYSVNTGTSANWHNWTYQAYTRFATAYNSHLYSFGQDLIATSSYGTITIPTDVLTNIDSVIGCHAGTTVVTFRYADNHTGVNIGIGYYYNCTRKTTGYVGSGNMGLRGMACDDDGNMWVGSYYNKSGGIRAVIWKIDSDDNITQYVPDINTPAYGACYDPVSKRAYFTGSTGSVAAIKLDPATATFSGVGSYNNYYGLGIDSAGNFYRPSMTGYLDKYDKDGTYVARSVSVGHPLYSCCVRKGDSYENVYCLDAGTRYFEIFRCSDMQYLYQGLLPNTHSSAFHGIAADPYNANTLWAMPYDSNGKWVLKISLYDDGLPTANAPIWYNCGTTGHYNYSDFTGYYNTLDYS